MSISAIKCCDGSNTKLTFGAKPLRTPVKSRISSVIDEFKRAVKKAGGDDDNEDSWMDHVPYPFPQPTPPPPPPVK